MRKSILMPVSMTALLLLSACASSSSEDRWLKTGADDTQRAKDFKACREYARSEIKTQSDIDQDIAAASRDPFGPSIGGGMNLSAAAASKRADRVTDECMRDLGYSPTR